MGVNFLKYIVYNLKGFGIWHFRNVILNTFFLLDIFLFQMDFKKMFKKYKGKNNQDMSG